MPSRLRGPHRAQAGLGAGPVPVGLRQIGPAGGPLKLRLSVEDVELEVDEDELTLKVRFGFSQLQIEGPAQEDR